MRRIAFLISADMVAGAAGARADQYEFELEFRALDPACRKAGFALTPVVWDEPFDSSGYAAIIIGPVWDYVEKRDAFLSALERWEAVCPVLNPPAIARWNSQKTYLKDLARAGAPVVPTVWAKTADPDTLLEAFDDLDCDEIVVKPVIGAGGWRQARIQRGSALPPACELPPAEAMIQPFLTALPTEGEFSFLFFGGVFSHAVLKRPAAGDYRVQSIYGGYERDHTPDPADLVLAQAALEAACRHVRVDSLLYARVDMARGLDGELALMELELIEPYFYPEQGPDCGRHFAAALLAALG